MCISPQKKQTILTNPQASFVDNGHACIFEINSRHLLTIYVNKTTQLIIKSGERDWKLVRHNRNLQVDDVLFHNDIMYVLDQGKGIYICDLTTIPGSSTNLRYFARFPTTVRDGQRSIVVSPSGEILLVCRSNVYPAAPQKTRLFNVFKLCRYPRADELRTKMTTWYETKNLGDKAIFLGQYHSNCININSNKTTTCSGGYDHPKGLQPDSIYFTNNNNDSYLYGYGSMQNIRKCRIDVGVFNMADGSIRNYCSDYSAKDVGIFTPLWFFPSLPGNWKHP